MRVNEHRQHAECFVAFDEAHATHVGGEIVHMVRALDGVVTRATLSQIELKIFDAGMQLMPLGKRLDIDGSNMAVAPSPEVCHQMPADEAAGASDHNALSGHPSLPAAGAPHHSRAGLSYPQRPRRTRTKLHGRCSAGARAQASLICVI